MPGIDDELIPEIPELHLPRLAQGGYVKANTPRLAVIGDNRREGEIVSPESKLLDMAQTAARMAAGGGNSEQIERMIALLEKIISLIEALDLVVNVDIWGNSQKIKGSWISGPGILCGQHRREAMNGKFYLSLMARDFRPPNRESGVPGGHLCEHWKEC